MDQATPIEGTFDASAPRFELRCWGVFRLHDRATGANCAPRGRKARALLAWLAFQREPVARERAAALLWGDRGEEQARSSLRQAVHELRALNDAPSLVQPGREHIHADPAPIETEIALLERISSGDDIGTLTIALARASGPLFPDLDGVSPRFRRLAADRARRRREAAARARACGRRKRARARRDRGRARAGPRARDDRSGE